MLRLNEKHRVRREAGGGFVCDSETGSTYVVNESAIAILEFVKEEHSREDVLLHLSRKYPGAIPESEERNVHKFLDEAVANGFILNV